MKIVLTQQAIEHILKFGSDILIYPEKKNPGCCVGKAFYSLIPSVSVGKPFQKHIEDFKQISCEQNIDVWLHRNIVQGEISKPITIDKFKYPFLKPYLVVQYAVMDQQPF